MEPDLERLDTLDKERENLVGLIECLFDDFTIHNEEQALVAIHNFLVSLYSCVFGNPEYIWHWDYLSPELNIQSHILIGSMEERLHFRINLLGRKISNRDWETFIPKTDLDDMGIALRGLEALHRFNLPILGQNETLTDFQVLVDRLLASEKMTHQDMRMLDDAGSALRKQNKEQQKRIFGEIFMPVRLTNEKYFHDSWPFPKVLFEKRGTRDVVASIYLRNSIRQVCLDLYRDPKSEEAVQYFKGVLKLLKGALCSEFWRKR